MKKATIDIGTNTAHLLIGSVINQRIKKVIYKKRFYTFLGEDGLEIIGPEALKRLYHALDFFALRLIENDCKVVKVIGTEGLRSAANSKKIYERIKAAYGWDVNIISGEEEADLIFEGVSQAMDLSAGHFLIMDIGGGSVEFIESKNGDKGYTNSFAIGISRLYETFHHKELLEEADILKMDEYLDDVLSEMWKILHSNFERMTMIGCAGTFEVFLTDQDLTDHNVRAKAIEVKAVNDLLNRMKNKNLSERALVKDLPKERAKYIVVALSLINYVTRRMESTSFVVCKYALKEGSLIQ